MSKQVTHRYNVSAAKRYTANSGEVKTQWVSLGTAVQFNDGSIVLNMNSLPTGTWWDGTCQFFKQEPRTNHQSGYAQQQQGYSQPQQGGYATQSQGYASAPQAAAPAQPQPDDGAPF